MRDRIKQIESKKHPGYFINIYQDDMAESPDAWGDDGVFLVGYHRDFTVDRGQRDKTTGRWTPGISQDLAQHIANNGRYEDGSTCQEAKDYLKKYHVFGLEAYIHSGVALYLSGGCAIDRTWDVSQVGLVFIAKTEARTRKRAEQLARGLLETWNDYLSGSVYGYLIERPNGEEGGGCWGFYGHDRQKSGLVDSAEDEIGAAFKEDQEAAKIALQAV